MSPRLGQRRPSPGRIALALVAAAAAAALPPALLLWPLLWLALPIGFLVALAHSVVLGLPLYLMLRRADHIGWLSAAAAGFLVGALPYALWMIATSSQEMIADPIAAAPGLQPFTLLAAAAGGCGLLGGLVFYLIARPAAPEVLDPEVWE